MRPDTAITATTYRCFVSYRHADNHEDGRRWATWLHQGLEKYPVPAGLVGEPNLRGRPIPANIFPVFRDEEELPAEADLSTPILRALENSLGMVVICSPRARASRFVDDEVRLFKRGTDGDRILGMVIAGSPDQTGLAADGCFPNAYLHRTDDRGNVLSKPESPRNLVDLRTHDGQEGWTDSAAHQAALEAAGMDEEEAEAEAEAFALHREAQFLRIVAHVLEVPPETLSEHHQRHQAELRKARLRSRILWGAFGLMLIAAAGKGIHLSIEQSEAAQAAARQAEAQAKVAIQKKAERESEEQKTRKAQAESAYSLAMSMIGKPEASAKAIEASLRIAAEAGLVLAQNELGQQLQGKDRGPAGLQEAVRWFGEAARQGHAPAMISLGLAYRDARGVDRDLVQAELWLRRAAEAKIGLAHLELSHLLKSTGRTAESLRSLDEAATAGHPEAQHELAKTFLAKTPQPDVVTARKWFRASAEQGFVPALCELGLTYLIPSEGSVDILEAIRWLQAADAKGDRVATLKLAQIFADETTIPKGRPEAFRWHLARATTGNTASQIFVGVAYRDGLDAPVDLKKAFDFLNKAANAGVADAQYNLGVMFAKGLTQFNSAASAFGLKERAARQGHLQAMADVAKLYLFGLEQGTANAGSFGKWAEREGFGKPAGEAKGLEWLRKAAEGGHVASMYELGRRHLQKFEKGKSPGDRSQAQRWLMAAAEKDDAEAQRTLGLFLFPSDQQTGIKWIRKAAENGEAEGQYALGIALRDGRGLKANRTEAIRWLRLAAGKYFAEAEYALALALLEEDEPKEVSQAADWMRKAADQGHPGAQHQLAELLLAGKGVKPDAVDAYKWLLLASTNPTATQDQRTQGLNRAKAAASRLTPSQRTEAQQAATLFSPATPQR